MRHASSPEVVRFGIFELDVAAGELRKQGRRINLQQQPCQVLALLLRRPGELVTREELQQALWPGDTFVEFDQGLNTAIKKIRQALGDSAENPRFVETLPRKGYRFIAPVNGAASAVSPAARGGRLLWIAAGLALMVVAASAAWLLHRGSQGVKTTKALMGGSRGPAHQLSGRRVLPELFSRWQSSGVRVGGKGRAAWHLCRVRGRQPALAPGERLLSVLVARRPLDRVPAVRTRSWGIPDLADRRLRAKTGGIGFCSRAVVYGSHRLYAQHLVAP